MKKILYIILAIILIAIAGGAYYWYFYILNPAKLPTTKIDPTKTEGFSPFNKDTAPTPPPKITEPVTEATTTPENTDTSFSLPKLRQISTTPIAGMSASSSPEASIVRFIERGTGHVFEANNLTVEIKKISNTILPKIYEAYSNKYGTAFFIRYIKDETDNITNFFAELRRTGSSTSETTFELKGKYLSGDINQVAVSPKGDKIFTWNIEGDRGIGYISSFDEKNKVKIADTPLTQVTIDWPEANIVSVNTKASALSSGFIYTIDTKSGEMKNIIGGIKGLTGKISADLSKIIYSARTNNNFTTSIRNLKDNTSQGVIFKTLSEKCVWSTMRKNEVYCAVPTDIPEAIYPDDWYRGNVSFVDQIWYLNTITGEVHLVANLIDLSKKLIDATELTLDPRENTLYFINKRDLTLWALDLNQ